VLWGRELGEQGLQGGRGSKMLLLGVGMGVVRLIMMVMVSILVGGGLLGG